jgi:hypothetical protein
MEARKQRRKTKTKNNESTLDTSKIIQALQLMFLQVLVFDDALGGALGGDAVEERDEERANIGVGGGMLPLQLDGARELLKLGGEELNRVFFLAAQTEEGLAIAHDGALLLDEQLGFRSLETQADVLSLLQQTEEQTTLEPLAHRLHFARENTLLCVKKTKTFL